MVESSAASHEPEEGQDLPSTPPLSEADLSAEPGPGPSASEEEVSTDGEPSAGGESAVEPEAQPIQELETPPPAEPEPAPASFVEPSADPAVATTLHIPASEASIDGEGGGEWELLTGKVRDFFSRADFQQQLQQYSGPLKLLAGFVVLLLLIRIYAALLGAIESLPLVPGLLELAGVFWLSRFGVTRLVRSSDRQKLLASWRERWASFRGQP